MSTNQLSYLQQQKLTMKLALLHLVPFVHLQLKQLNL